MIIEDNKKPPEEAVEVANMFSLAMERLVKKIYSSG
jgi:hypothetical protein